MNTTFLDGISHAISINLFAYVLFSGPSFGALRHSFFDGEGDGHSGGLVRTVMTLVSKRRRLPTKATTTRMTVLIVMFGIMVINTVVHAVSMAHGITLVPLCLSCRYSCTFVFSRSLLQSVTLTSTLASLPPDPFKGTLL